MKVVNSQNLGHIKGNPDQKVLVFYWHMSLINKIKYLLIWIMLIVYTLGIFASSLLTNMLESSFGREIANVIKNCLFILPYAATFLYIRILRTYKRFEITFWTSLVSYILLTIGGIVLVFYVVMAVTKSYDPSFDINAINSWDFLAGSAMLISFFGLMCLVTATINSYRDWRITNSKLEEHNKTISKINWTIFIVSAFYTVINLFGIICYRYYINFGWDFVEADGWAFMRAFYDLNLMFNMALFILFYYFCAKQLNLPKVSNKLWGWIVFPTIFLFLALLIVYMCIYQNIIDKANKGLIYTMIGLALALCIEFVLLTMYTITDTFRLFKNIQYKKVNLSKAHKEVKHIIKRHEKANS